VIDHFCRSFLDFPGQAIVVENAAPPLMAPELVLQS